MKYRVLHVHALPVVSGSGINTFLTMRDADRRRFTPELACAPGGELETLVRGSGLAFHPFPNFVQAVDPANDVAAVVRLTRFLARRRYHIVHTHNSKTGFIGRLAGKLAKVPVVVHTVHGFSFHDQEPPLRRRLFRLLERAAAGWADRTIFISQPLIDWARKERILKKGQPIAKIYSGIEIEKFRPASKAQRREARNRWGIPKNAFVVGIVSKLWEGKGHATLMEAFSLWEASAKNSRLVIVGEGPLRAELEDLARRKGQEGKILFTGFQPDVASVLAILDLAVLPSLFEGMGRVLLEAMAMGIPVIGSEVGGIPDLIRHGREGFLVPPGNPYALAAAVRVVIDNPHLAAAMGRAGLERVSGQFGARQMVRSIERVYLEALAEKGMSHFADDP
ncbi:MAG: glycosyltransferase family 4 protein [Desulfobacterales bacterium]|jgi:glycosyltransferase involved in cell wall biosynthesis